MTRVPGVRSDAKAGVTQAAETVVECVHVVLYEKGHDRDLESYSGYEGYDFEVSLFGQSLCSRPRPIAKMAFACAVGRSGHVCTMFYVARLIIKKMRNCD